MSATGAIQQAIAAKLTADVQLMLLLTGGIVDFRAIPPGQTYPFLTIGDSTEVPDDRLGRNGYDTTVTLHIFSRQPGAKECQAILTRLNALLNKQPLALGPQNHVGTWYEFSQPMGDPSDDRITHMPVRYRIQAQEPTTQATGTYLQAVLLDAPIVYMRCNETSGLVAHDAGGTQAGSISASGVTYRTPGAIARDTDAAFRLDGLTGCVIAPATIALTSGFSVEMWVRPATIPLSGNPRIAANSHTDADNKGFQLLLNNNGNGGGFFVGNGTTQQDIYFTGLFSTTQWTHVVASYDGAVANVYLNGVLVGTAPYVASLAASGYPIAFGKNPAYNGDFFAGGIDECAVYQSALNAARVLAHYQAGS